jgi:hypothetical protein
MPCMTVQINNIAHNFDLYTLLFKGSQFGYTCSPPNGINPNDPVGTVSAMASYLSIQADPGNTAATYIYVGDANLANNGTCQGKSLGPGVIDVREADFNALHLRDIYVAGSATGVRFSIEVHFE